MIDVFIKGNLFLFMMKREKGLLSNYLVYSGFNLMSFHKLILNIVIISARILGNKTFL